MFLSVVVSQAYAQGSVSEGLDVNIGAIHEVDTQKVGFEKLIPDFESYAEEGIKEYSKRSFKPKAYVPATLENFINMYWAMGVNAIDNASAVDGYMMATECSIYEAHHINEFRWQSIRSIAKDIIQMNTKDYYSRYEFVQPLVLTDYDLRRKGFNVSGDTAYRGAIRLEIVSDAFNMPCVYRGEVRSRHVPYHPVAISVKLNHPVNITFVSVPPGLAKEYIKIYEEIAKSSGQPIVRKAYVRFRVLITNFKELEILNNGREMAHFFGYIENYEIFADPDLKISLYKSQTYTGHLEKLKHMNR